MRIVARTGIALCLAWAHLAWAGCEAPVARVVSVEGVVELRAAGTEAWTPAAREAPLCAGDTLRTGADGRAALALVNETVVRLDHDTALTLTALEPGAPSLLELLSGIAHFISRVPRSLKVKTPVVNAAIEGTEFVVAFRGGEARVTVIEGVVRVENAAGGVRLAAGEAAVARAGEAPAPTLLARPRRAVQWALYFPPLWKEAQGAPGEAGRLLARGRVDAARRLLEKDDSPAALALKAVIAVVLGETARARELAERAVAAAPDSAPVQVALSYARQAGGDLEGAAAAARRAAVLAPGSAVARARLAELELILGHAGAGLEQARRAVELDPRSARARAVLGFARLMGLDVDTARADFEAAIALDQADPLPRLGLGLALIRQGRLAAGRRQLEIAVSLDPGRSILRSTLGKAYFEEKRAPLDAGQFALARELDPNDPTPWFYDAIRLQSENRPVEALQSAERAMALNGNRAPVRPVRELDRDEAARGTALARIYAELGFWDSALLEGWQATTAAPGDAAAHRFLADAYAALPRHEVARASELLQSQLLQDANVLPIQPWVAESTVSSVAAAGPAAASPYELHPLFTRDGTSFWFNTLGGSNDTVADDLVVAGIDGRFSYSVGQFHYETDGYRPNNDVTEDLANVYLQYAFTPNFSAQVEFRHLKSDNGDLGQNFDPGDFSTRFRRSEERDTFRLGARQRLDDRSDLLWSFFDVRRDSSQLTETAGPVIDQRSRSEADQVELQYRLRRRGMRLVAGAGSSRVDLDQASVYDWTGVFGVACPPSPPFPPVPCSAQTSSVQRHETLYTYATFPAAGGWEWTLGVARDWVEQGPQDVNRTSPKLGLSWRSRAGWRLRAAWFETVKRVLVVEQTLEPTHVAGFNQWFDDPNGTLTRRYGVGVDGRAGPVRLGLEASRRRLRIPAVTVGKGVVEYLRRGELLWRAWAHWAPAPRWAMALEPAFATYDNPESDDPGLLSAPPRRLETLTVPLRVTYHHPAGWRAGLTATFVEQDLVAAAARPLAQAHEDFTLVDLDLGWRLPRRAGIVSLQVRNLFDQAFLYQDLDFTTGIPVVETLIPERTVWFRLSLGF